ncbi:hypothetical protein IEN91_05045 [Bacillus velezensis]|nr:hypothetical protein IEN91_05045 [Bacillus velezensis]
MCPMNSFNYSLKLKGGYLVANVESSVLIHVGDELVYRGNKLLVIDKTSDSSLTVEKTGSIIAVD